MAPATSAKRRRSRGRMLRIPVQTRCQSGLAAATDPSSRLSSGGVTTTSGVSVDISPPAPFPTPRTIIAQGAFAVDYLPWATQGAGGGDSQSAGRDYHRIHRVSVDRPRGASPGYVPFPAIQSTFWYNSVAKVAGQAWHCTG